MNQENTNEPLSKTAVMQSVRFHNELRIGNYIQDYDKTKILVVENIDSTLKYKELNGTESSSNHITNLKPIEISEDWLIKIGYEKTGSFYRISKSRFAEVYVSSEGIDVCVHSVTLDHIQYVHQLQNLYFSLTGRELTVA